MEVKIDGVRQYTSENTNPVKFSNVKIYAGDPWHTAVDIKVRNFYAINMG